MIDTSSLKGCLRNENGCIIVRAGMIGSLIRYAQSVGTSRVLFCV